MIITGVFQTVEFYVISVLVAAFVVAFLSKGAHIGPVREFLFAGVITREFDSPREPALELICNDDGSVLLRRHGLLGVTDDGAVSLAVKLKGFDMTVQERTIQGRAGEPVDTASFVLDFMGAEHYFISYSTDLTGADSPRVTSFTLHNRAGNHVYKKLI